MDYDLTSAYDYDLPAELIADSPSLKRSDSRLMVGDPDGPQHHSFADLADLLSPNDLLVFNDTRVVAARVHAHKSTGGAVELFVIDVCEPQGADRWSAVTDVLVLRCMTRSSKRLRPHQQLMAGGRVLEIRSHAEGIAVVTVQTGGCSAEALLAEIGEIPLPPYIVRRRADLGAAAVAPQDRDRYQTIYARRPGAVAAPTAGLHFDADLMRKLAERGVSSTTLTLEVGPGTFRPVTAESLSEHPMHSERYVIPATLGPAIEETRRAGGRVVAVGTTSVRTLECEGRREVPFEPGERSTDLFIKPGFEFRVIDAMITNFHLPRSTLLALVFAFGGPDLVRGMYATAVQESYRFYSYGDAMLLRSHR